ncbi:hypothetical protein [Streptomyces viridochromogenes]|uniref:Uncharacterized protein n=1 Tax=Streptomyces viridochromogenes Tue57 TaxID=1160705 RepID=L8PNF8_STRVR|nr:hypothetical protein [Streptomyces viridochromogenes]ELS57574.1 hypothetical protein STVIR_1425 [Streptomyces viridochromogenes Tue57]
MNGVHTSVLVAVVLGGAGAPVAAHDKPDRLSAQAISCSAQMIFPSPV